MLRETKASGKAKPRRVIHRGICAAAAELGVNRTHLWLVLSGRRQSRRLSERYAKLNTTKS
jgi:hypothetical protein